MERKEIFTLFYNKIDELLLPKGFKSKKTQLGTFRGNKIDFEWIGFSPNHMYFSTYNFNCSFGIRSSLISKIRTQANETISGIDSVTLLYEPRDLCMYYYKDASDWESIWENEEKISGRVVNFNDQSSIDKWFAGFEKFLYEAGYDFLNRFKVPKDYDEWLNKPLLENPEVFVKSGSFPFAGLIAAKLVENPEYEKIYSIWLNHFEKVNYKAALVEIKGLKKYLDKYSVEKLLNRGSC
ncbi:MAG: hypothetical protein P1P88_19640 [Bacteroidales bacterium]|nr:hypothetical protein [Bacteroidales bacterium]